MTKLRTVRVYGWLGAKYGRSFRLAVNNAADAVRALACQLPGFERDMAMAHERGHGFAVFYDRENLSVEQLHDPPGEAVIRIAPMVIGAKKQGILQIVVGIVLVVVGLYTTIFSGGTSALLVQYGWGLIIGGVIQLLTPSPKGRSSSDRPDNQASFNFNGPINTQAQGNPAPVLYGRNIVGSAVLSAGISAVDQVIAPVPGVGSGGGSTTDHGTWYTTSVNNNLVV